MHQNETRNFREFASIPRLRSIAVHSLKALSYQSSDRTLALSAQLIYLSAEARECKVKRRRENLVLDCRLWNECKASSINFAPRSLYRIANKRESSARPSILMDQVYTVKTLNGDCKMDCVHPLDGGVEYSAGFL